MSLPLHQAIETHWRENRPSMVRTLEAEGRLSKAVEAAALRTTEAESAAIRSGTPAHEAQETFREQWAFLPSEQDEPNLPADRNPATSA